MATARSQRRFRHPRAAGVATAGVLVLVSACSNQLTATQPDRPVTRAGATPTPSASPAPTPAPTSGPLTESDLPDPGVLGKDWETYVEPGGPNSVVVGNGSHSQAREIDDLLAGLTPVGCPEEALRIEFPRPEHALEGSYRNKQQSPGSSLVLQFAGEREASEFLAKFGEQVDACPPDERDSAGPLGLGFDRLAMRGGRLGAVRQEYGEGADPNRYLVIAASHRDRVAILFVGNARTPDRDRIGRNLGEFLER